MSSEHDLPPLAPIATPLAGLYPHQESSIVFTVGRLVAGVRRVLLVAPTGAGKTVLACALIRYFLGLGLRCLFLAHRKELITQASEKLDAAGIDHGVIMADHPRRRPELLVQVASVQTLSRRETPPADCVFVDEAHRAPGDTYLSVIAACFARIVIGLTATPWRTDGRGLGGLFEELVLVATPAQLLAKGYLVPFDGFSFDVPDLSAVRVRGGDYDEGQLARAVNTSYVVGGIVERWQEHARGARTVVFTVDIDHSRNIVARFLAAGIPAEHLDGDVPLSERKAILSRLKAGETLVVSNCGVLCEGWDMPECACCILARPTQSLVLYLQQAGRVLRLAPGKTRARIHDHAGCLTRFGLPDAERDYSLDSDTRRSAPDATTVQTCSLCARVFPLSARHCPDCYVPETRGEPGTIVETDGHLVEIAELRLLEELRRIPERLMAKKAAEYLRLKEEAKRNGYKPGWAYFRYRETFHEEPKFPRGFLEACRPASTAFNPLDQLALTTGGQTR